MHNLLDGFNFTLFWPHHANADFGSRLASLLGYPYSESWPYCPMTGEFSNWCAEHGLACLLVELHTDLELTTEEIAIHLSAILAVLQDHSP